MLDLFQNRQCFAMRQGCIYFKKFNLLLSRFKHDEAVFFKGFVHFGMMDEKCQRVVDPFDVVGRNYLYKLNLSFKRL